MKWIPFSRDSVRALPNKLFHHERYIQMNSSLRKRPFVSFLIALAILFGIIALGTVISRLNRPEEKEVAVVKNVTVYSVGEAPRVTLQARIEKEGVIQIVAQTPGIVQEIHVKEGERVQKGETLINLSSNYQGGNAASVQRQLASVQYSSTVQTNALQKEALNTQRHIAEKSYENSEEIRKITEQSRDDTRDQLEQTEDAIEELQQNIDTLEDLDIPLVGDFIIGQLEGNLQQAEAGQAQIRAQLSQLELQSDPNKPPAELARLQKDLALKQLEIQEKGLAVSQQVSGLQVQLAAINESLFFPVSPCNATVERVHVRFGQAVNPGTVLVTLTTDSTDATAVVQAPASLALQASRFEASFIEINGEKLSVTPVHISQNATEGLLYSLLYTLPSGITGLTDGEYVPIDVPVGLMNTTSAIPYIPIDVVYQTQDEAYVYVIRNGKASSQKVVLGNVYGKYVEVTSGLKTSDQVILERNVLAGDTVKISQ